MLCCQVHPPVCATRSTLFSTMTLANSICSRQKVSQHHVSSLCTAPRRIAAPLPSPQRCACMCTQLKCIGDVRTCALPLHLIKQQIRHIPLAASRLGPFTIRHRLNAAWQDGENNHNNTPLLASKQAPVELPPLSIPPAASKQCHPAMMAALHPPAHVGQQQSGHQLLPFGHAEAKYQSL